MNKPIRRLALFCMVLFGALLLNVNYIQGIQAEDLREHPRNQRQIAEEFETERGPIIVANESVAYSEATEEGTYKYQRYYENSELYSHITGWHSLFSTTGIEKTENSLLNGSDSRLFVRNFIDTLTGEDNPGASVHLTLDPQVQQAALKGLRNVGENGAAIALDPETGAVLASASVPTFDANPLASHDGTQVNEAYGQLESDEDKPLLNRAIDQTYPPGSTFKLVTAAAALENGASPDSTMEAPEVLQLPAGGTMPNAFGAPCNGGSPDTLAHSIEISCNTSMANWAIELGEETMAEQARAFGLNSGTMNIPLKTAESHYPTGLDGSQLGQTGIGQFDVRTTPLQMAMVAGGIANGGEVMKPYLVDSVRGPDLSEIISADPEPLNQAVSSGTAEQLRDMMVRVTEGDEGSGTGGAIPGVKVAGKTGTAETGEGPTHNWFVSFAPADDPEVAVAVLIEHGGGSGGTLAAPVAKDIMEAVLSE